MKVENIFDAIPNNIKEEVFENIIENDKFKLERIISEAHASPPDFWYDQNKNEFVMLLKGSAQLSFREGRNIILKPGDYLIIPAHTEHRVDWTDDSEKTVWLALHY
ncbi:cupin domain-containing protein [Bacteroidota bacterium]